MDNKKTYNPFSLEGKNILVTGASSGIGRAIAVECSRMGANVVATARDETRLAETLAAMDSSGRHKSVIADLSDGAALEALVESIETPLDGVVQCAGLMIPKPFQFLSEDDVDAVMSVNFYAPVVLSRLLLKKKKLANQSSIVFVSSINGVKVTSVGSSVYAASKGAINGIAKTMALELAVKGVRVNCVNPGMVETAILSEDDFTQEQKSEDAKRYPLKRYGRPEEVAYATIYLLSDASAWTTGTNLLIDGGYTLL